MFFRVMFLILWCAMFMALFHSRNAPEIILKPCNDSGIMGSDAIVGPMPPFPEGLPCLATPTETGPAYAFQDSNVATGTYGEFLANYTLPKKLCIVGSGSILVEIDLETGNASMAGDPNKAAKVFWDAVGMERRRR